MSQATCNKEKAESKKNQIASDFLSLVNEDALVSMIYFLSAFHNTYWKKYCDLSKKIDPIAGKSGYISKHMAVIYYCMEKDLSKIASSCKLCEEFKSFLNRYELCSEKEKQLLCIDLPRLFFNDSVIMLNKHFKQWVEDKLLPISLLSESSIVTSVAKILLEKIIDDETVDFLFGKVKTHLLSFRDFLQRHTNIEMVGQQRFYLDYLDAIAVLNNGATIKNEASEVKNFKNYAFESWLPLASTTQGVESSIKDASLCKVTGKKERTTTHLAMLRSVFATGTTTLTKVDPAFEIRKRKNENVPDDYAGKTFNKNLILHIMSHFPSSMNKIERLKNNELVSKERHYRDERLMKAQQDFIAAQSTTREPNARQRMTGVTFSPLLVGKVEINKLETAHVPIAQKELQLREVSFEIHELNNKGKRVKNGIKCYRELLRNNEHPEYKNIAGTLAPEEKKKYSCFMPKFLNASVWTKYVVRNAILEHRLQCLELKLGANYCFCSTITINHVTKLLRMKM